MLTGMSQNEKEKILISRVFASTRQVSDKWRTKSDMDGHLSGGASKHRIQNLSNFILRHPFFPEEIKGEEFRSTYHLISSSFELEDFDGNTKVTTRGIGHGLGMSQYTAEKMAEDGKTYQEILNYFFEGTSFGEVAEILVKPE